MYANPTQDSPVALADHGIALPVVELPLGTHDSRVFIDRELIGNVAASVITAIALAPGSLATQVSMTNQVLFHVFHSNIFS